MGEQTFRSKIIALYLPQFYETEENNQWWGKGYSDWVAVKKSKAYFSGQTQPRIPLNHNYYDLSKSETLQWQADLAHKYGIDGFCIYHYYSNGKLMMNRPAEILLEHKDIKIEYFFSWANHDFRKQWFGQDGRLLRRQEYGEKEDWKRHFEYLLPFFRDERYMKMDNKPVFVIYDVFHIENFGPMMKYWNELAKREGFGGLFLIATRSRTNLKSEDLLELQAIDKVFVFEPMNFRTNGFQSNYIYTTSRRIKTVLIRLHNKILKNRPRQEKYSIPKAYQAILKRRMLEDEYYGFFTEWDNTPRYQGKSVAFVGGSPELFEQYFEKVLKKSCLGGKEFIFINAWNEWGETAYLEPDTRNGYAYLEAVKKCKDRVWNER